jgi:hypothetical protein
MRLDKDLQDEEVHMVKMWHRCPAENEVKAALRIQNTAQLLNIAT